MNAQPKHRRAWLTDVILVAVALVFQLYFISRAWKIHVNLFGDAVYYDHSATLLLLKHVYSYWSYGPAAQVTPGYPFFLAFAYALTHLTSFHHQIEMHVVQSFQHLLIVGQVYLLYRIMRYILPNWASVVGAVLWMIYPPVNWAADQLLTETLYVTTLLAFTWTFLIALRKMTFWYYVLAGATLGITTLVRPTVLPLVFAPLLLLFSREYRVKIVQFLRNWAGYLGTFILCMLPWWIRNVVTMHQFILTDTDMGNPLLFGSDPNFEQDTHLADGLSPTQQEQLAIHRIIQGFTHEPFIYLKWYTVDKLGLLFGTPWFSAHPGVHADMLTKVTYYFAQAHLVWVIAGVIGLILGIWKPYLRWLSALVLFLIVVQLPFIPINRYVYPVMPYLFVGVMYFVIWLTNLIKNRRKPVINA
ncbi:hypothetical protein AAC03nite_27050 [Alicyclobacillus acidoterrestris]|uniref:glycosyltransferase family 39 protein n=1 Tax=Alicyclobacillus suci TaxID=2816080 RepID=UPI001192CA49|nr:glycosyltransferase family 39 protein [Alicyclobacillus suci]GEO26920.1 hypothetical protein AAC03nite_27050 [Alicyclobacillus acidoterrestris]